MNPIWAQALEVLFIVASYPWPSVAMAEASSQKKRPREDSQAEGTRFRTLNFRIDCSDGSVATAKATLLWDKAPQTCEAITKQLPIETHCWHGRNSGAEALLVTPTLISHVPQDATENATTEHKIGNILFGYEPAEQISAERG